MSRLDFEYSIQQLNVSKSVRSTGKPRKPRQTTIHLPAEAGLGKNSMNAAHRLLVDTNILVYRCDGRYPGKKRINLGLCPDRESFCFAARSIEAASHREK